MQSHTSLPSTLVLLLFASLCPLQGVASGQDQHSRPESPQASSATTPTNYVLGAGDQITLFVSDLDELSNKPMRINAEGDVMFPLVGRIHAGGLTVEQLAKELEARLNDYVNKPDIVVSVSDYRSQPVSVLGAVTTPGVYQVEGNKSLSQVLSAAGGLSEYAGDTIKITRDLKWGPIPLPDAKDDPTGRFSIASVSVKTIMTASNPVENIAMKPEDIIAVPAADHIYCVGAVNRPGGFELFEKESLSALQVVALSQGLQRTAAPGNAKVLREVPGSTTRTEIPVNLKLLILGKAPDFPLKAGDILFVPNSASKSASYRTLEAIVNAATGLAIYGRY